MIKISKPLGHSGEHSTRITKDMLWSASRVRPVSDLYKSNWDKIFIKDKVEKIENNVEIPTPVLEINSILDSGV